MSQTKYVKGYYWAKYLDELTIAVYYGTMIGWCLPEFREPYDMGKLEILEKIDPPSNI